jgi:hypothetical protein
MSEKQYLNAQYNKTGAYCDICGRKLISYNGEPLGRYFVMDVQGRFYCTRCDSIFNDVDERIYVPEED